LRNSASAFELAKLRPILLCPSPRTRFVQIEYEEHGAAGDLPVLLLHGFPDSLRTWDRVIDNLKGERLRFLVPHLRGFGATRVDNPDAMSGQTGALAQDVLDFADALGADRFVLVGHDWGARTAYSLAVLAPHRIRGFVALSTPYLMFQGKRESPAQVRAYWYQWYFNSERGRAAFEAEPIAFCEYLWPTWSPEWKFTHAELDSAKSAWSNPQFVPFVISYYRHRYGNTLAHPPMSNSNRNSTSSPCPGFRSHCCSAVAWPTPPISRPRRRAKKVGSRRATSASNFPT
jgi:pimeloyl-ACP methyl ester carboxylesterase